MISVNLDATHAVAGLEHSSWAVAGRTETTFPVVSASRVDSSLDAAAVRLRGLHQQARALRALQSNALRARRRHEVERRDVPMLRLKHSMRRFVSAVRFAKATRLAEEEARLSAAERVQLERARSFAFAHRGTPDAYGVEWGVHRRELAPRATRQRGAHRAGQSRASETFREATGDGGAGTPRPSAGPRGFVQEMVRAVQAQGAAPACVETGNRREAPVAVPPRLVRDAALGLR